MKIFAIVSLLNVITGATGLSSITRCVSNHELCFTNKNQCKPFCDECKESPAYGGLCLGEISDEQAKDLEDINYYAHSAYCTSGIEDWSCSPNCVDQENTSYLKSYGRHSLTASTKSGVFVYNRRLDAVIFAFTGTVGGRDFITDADSKLVPYYGFGDSEDDFFQPYVHEGFYYQYNQSWVDTLRSDFATFRERYVGARFFFTGHSLGGALATLAIADLIVQYPDYAQNMYLYTYGSPRVGNFEFADLLNEKLGPRAFRVTHEADPVTLTPPPKFRLNEHGAKSGVWVHVGREYWLRNINGKTTITLCDFGRDDPESSSCSIGQREVYKTITTTTELAELGLVTILSDLKYHVSGYYNALPHCNKVSSPPRKLNDENERDPDGDVSKPTPTPTPGRQIDDLSQIDPQAGV